ncbi:DsbA family protein [Chachezhania antarctica]|uniref:DsbA family protein n=1 Tax=Chachezhania antarctica TaxID=2340860 RepID=UPI000EB476D8|nr:DsbA family protein [Chachezhania antarctica]|tara:strand:+ start:2840 stop:3460 length:621 start_codon:yes stop_codon:yes gene_type:complete
MTRMMTLIGAAALMTMGLLAVPALAQSDAETPEIVEMVLGDPDAPVEIKEYASFTCPHCASFHTGAFKQLKKDYIDTGKVKLVYRDVYFDRFGLWASMMARCGGEEKFFGIADMIYNTQADWTRAGDPTAIVGELRKIGKISGIDDAELDACFADAEKAQALVEWYQANATEDGIQATPTFIISGDLVENQPYDDLKAVIEEKLGN